MHQDEINLLDYWNILRRRRLLVIILFAAPVVITAVVGFVSTKYYKSETVVIVSGSEQGSLGAALSALPLGGALAGVAGVQTPADKVLVVLKSRTIAEAVIQRFNLLRVFYEDAWDPGKNAWKVPSKPPLMQDAVRKLTKEITTFNKSKEGAITVSVEWKDPRLAAEIANYYITALTGFLNEKAINITTQIVDRAVTSERKSRPKIKLNMIFAGVAGLFAGVFFAFFFEYIERNRPSQ